MVIATPINRHMSALKTSSFLTAYFRRKHTPGAAMITPEEVIDALNQAEVSFVVMGTHGAGAWRSEPRATQDVDVLVVRKDHNKAVRVLSSKYPNLDVQDTTVVTRFVDPSTKKPVIDLMKPLQKVYRIVFRNTIEVEQSHRIPNLEMALVSKFAAMISPDREDRKKFIDVGDFIDMVKHNLAELNLARLSKLADKVYLGGAQEILALVENIKAGRRIQI
jgi:hypothetical protein